MSPAQQRWLITLASTAAALAFALVALGVWSRILEHQSLSRQRELAQLQDDINRGQASEKVFLGIVQDLAPIAHKAEIQALLGRYGIKVAPTPPK
ncbi:MAG: hypothetical protein IT578_06385 [Verrucomicrobiae bacterium]|nr:hypothetical protein [Verrucomicrobiae bacterium]